MVLDPDPTNPPTVEGRDDGGNLVDGVDVGASIETGGGFLSGDVTRPRVAGLVAFDHLAIGGGSGTRTLRVRQPDPPAYLRGFAQLLAAGPSLLTHGRPAA